MNSAFRISNRSVPAWFLKQKASDWRSMRMLMVTSPTRYLSAWKRACAGVPWTSINKGLPGHRERDVCTWLSGGCFHNVKTPRCMLVPQQTCQIRFCDILGVTEQAFQIRFIGVRIVLLCHQGVVQFDWHLLDHGVQETINWDDFLVSEIRSIGFGDLDLEFYVTLGQVDVVGGRFDVEFDGTATLDSWFGVIRLSSSA